MGLNQVVKLRDGTEKPIPDNWTPYHLNCPIDGTQLAEDVEYSGRYYSCMTCDLVYSIIVGRITQEQLERQAKGYLRDAQNNLIRLDTEKSKLLRLLELAKQNNFP